MRRLFTFDFSPLTSTPTLAEPVLSTPPTITPDWSKPFETLRRKWHEVPSGALLRRTTGDLAKLSDADLLAFWKKQHADCSTGRSYSIRGWYYDLYKDQFRGRRVLDVGSGLGFDALTFAAQGAMVTCADIVQSNLDLLARLARIMSLGQSVSFHYIEDLNSLTQLPADFDFLWAQGSLINAPFEQMKPEISELARHLKIGGRWIELAYPRIRWEREGRLPFSEWGKKTDGPATPWMEWYDLDKLRQALAPAEFDTVLYFEFRGGEFNWFDLIRRS